MFWKRKCMLDARSLDLFFLYSERDEKNYTSWTRIKEVLALGIEGNLFEITWPSRVVSNNEVNSVLAVNVSDFLAQLSSFSSDLASKYLMTRRRMYYEHQGTPRYLEGRFNWRYRHPKASCLKSPRKYYKQLEHLSFQTCLLTTHQRQMPLNNDN